MGFRYRIMQFMSGRYGLDDMTYGLLAVGVVLSVINIFFRFTIFQLLVYAVMFYALFRILSRNIEARRRENMWFKEKMGIIKQKRDFYNRKKADKLHIYKKCPQCKAVLRLPHRIGVHKTVCPRCSKEFTVRVKK